MELTVPQIQKRKMSLHAKPYKNQPGHDCKSMMTPSNYSQSSHANSDHLSDGANSMNINISDSG